VNRHDKDKKYLHGLSVPFRRPPAVFASFNQRSEQQCTPGSENACTIVNTGNAMRVRDESGLFMVISPKMCW
jgi:hypothetical protein